MPPERETFGVEEDKLTSRMGVRTRARRGKQMEKARQSTKDRDLEQMTDSGSSRERIEEKGSEKKYKLPTPYLLFSIKLIFFKWLLQVSLRGNIYSYHNAAYTHTSQ